MGASLPPGPSIKQFNVAKASAANAWFPIGFRGRGLPGSGSGGGSYDTSNTTLMDQQAYQAPSWTGVSSIRLVYGGFDMGDIGEVDRAVNVQCTASVYTRSGATPAANPSASATTGATTLTFPASGFASQISIGTELSDFTTPASIPANTFVTNVVTGYNASAQPTTVTVTLNQGIAANIPTSDFILFQGNIVPVTVGGSRTFTVDRRRGFVVTDPIGVALTAGQTFYVKTFSTFSATGFLSQPQNNLVAGREGCTRVGATDQTMSPFTPSGTSGGVWGPVGILAQLPAAKPSLLIIGDSIAFGATDGFTDASGRIGFVQRSLGNNIPWFSIARPGQAVSAYVTRFPGAVAALGVAQFTDVLIEYCRNDLAAGSYSNATVKSSLATFAAPFIAAGKRVWVCTACPTTTSTDSWATLANQTVSGSNEANRLLYNADIRANWASYGYSGLIDLASAIESTASPGKWNVSGGAWTGDGIHPNTHGVDGVVASGIITPTMFPLS